jgi:Transposase DDE domain
MRSTGSHNITSGQVHQWTVDGLMQAKLVKDHGWLCKAAVVFNIVLRAAARSTSVSAACRDLANAPCDQAVMNALGDGLPKTLPVLERRLNEALTSGLPGRMRRRSWEIAIDWHLSPYYGRPHKSRNELYYGKPKQGTKNFHAYATACIISYGHRYTIALSWVRRHESLVTVLRRLLERIRTIGLKIRRVFMDRAFFNVPVVEFLQHENVPFVMPVMFRGRAPKNRRKATGLRWIKQQSAGWYRHTMKNRKRQVTVNVCVGYRRHRNRKDGKQRKQKLLFATWRVKGSPTEIREQYRKRFGIESSYRQMREARIYTCTRDPHLRLFFVAVALFLRNAWVWLHLTKLADGDRSNPTLRLERLRFKRMLGWIVHEITNLLHDGSIACVDWDPK